MFTKRCTVKPLATTFTKLFAKYSVEPFAKPFTTPSGRTPRLSTARCCRKGFSKGFTKILCEYTSERGARIKTRNAQKRMSSLSCKYNEKMGNCLKGSVMENCLNENICYSKFHTQNVSFLHFMRSFFFC